ncbi:prolactin isoform X4 [Fukomys damarensis]|uniref:prolactin isoform X4 n=1 Tax=Fukomys damarensis TaxID=885580 RepID=UPI00053FA462|nr:prolactin isoform X4 [Fukomys damarensis]
MDIKGKGSVLLLLVSTLVLCQNVSSSTCVPREKCEVMLQGLYNNASYLAWSIRFHGEKACLDLVNLHYSRPTYFLSSRKRCHTADILTRPERRGARRMQEKDLLHMVMRLLDSWKEPLPHVAEETHKFMKFYSPIKKKDESIYLRYQQFKSVIIEIASKYSEASSLTAEHMNPEQIQQRKASEASLSRELHRLQLQETVHSRPRSHCFEG